uniref:Uncharacterized protein n=1 Tax=Lutzomyia longipalpis TaxID=7200 RepID=A0A7G3B446_LUTLO
MCQSNPCLHYTKSQTNTDPWTFTKRNPSIWVAFLYVFICESIRIECFGIRIYLWVMVNAINWDRYESSLLNNMFRPWY